MANLTVKLTLMLWVKLSKKRTCLVHPSWLHLLRNQSTERSVYLPLGKWHDFYSGQYVGSNTTLLVKSELLNDKIPCSSKMEH